MMKKRLMYLGVFLLLTGCLHNPDALPEPGTDITAFLRIWEDYESLYPLFSFKDTNWMAMGESYYEMAFNAGNQDELIEIIADMISELNDPALLLISADGDTVYTCEKEYVSNVDMGVLTDNYLDSNGFVDEVDGFGWCDPSVLPYAYFTEFPSEVSSSAAFYDQFIAQCVSLEVPAVIIDVRMNPVGYRYGGEMPWFNHFTMSRFLEHSRVGAIYRTRIGLGYDDYYDLHPAIDPGGSNQYLGTVYLLTGGACIEAAEDMAANMAYFPNAVLVGDTTGGTNTAVSYTNYEMGYPLENWHVAVGYCTLLTHDFKWVEGIGVPPDVLVESTPEDFASGVDPVLEHAIDLLEQYR